MPRNPAAKKNQHSNRHENGLVGPGKRVTKQKSNGHLTANGRSHPPPQPASVTPALEAQRVSNDTDGSRSKVVSDTAPVLKTRTSESAVDGHDQRWAGTNGHAPGGSPRLAMAKSKHSPDINPLQIATTILKSCPAADTVALLFVLLALPSMVLTIVQALFASLTLMPPAHVSPVSFLSLFDVFQGSAGSPSLGTMAVVDVICLGLWICLWNWAQNFALDLAQIQIAITLGSGNSGQSSAINALCFLVVLLLHSVRSRQFRSFVSNVSIPLPRGHLSLPSQINDLLVYLPAETDLGDTPGPPAKLRSLFAIHILSQAFMAFVRKRVADSQSTTGSRSSRRHDTEAFAGSQSTQDLQQPESTSAATSSGIDYQASPAPGVKDFKDKMVSSKKRRRQANQVRSRQPFWAALASTKVHVLREVEHSKGQSAAVHDDTATAAGPSLETVCVTGVEPSSIHFEISYDGSLGSSGSDARVSELYLFCVRINGARWHSVSTEMPKIDNNGLSRLQGSISGLAPDCTYTCTFTRTSDDEEFACVMVKTPALVDGDVASTLIPTPARGTQRPSSPSTTLRNSIQTAEARLNEARSRLNKSKRAHKAAVTKIEKDIDKANASLKSSSDDTKLKQKYLQAERSIQSTQDATEAIVTELDNLEVVPEHEVADYDRKKAAFEKQNKMLNEANEALDTAKATAKEELACVTNELTQLTSRKDRLQARSAKLTEQHDRITQANVQGMNEKERKAAESVATEIERQRQEQDLTNSMSAMYHEHNEIVRRIQAQLSETKALEDQQRELVLKHGGPTTPEGILPGERGPSRPLSFPSQGSSFGLPATMAMGPQASPFLAYANTLPVGQRPRSNTNQSAGANSNFSGNFDDADPIPPMLGTAEFETGEMNGRQSSNSSRGKNNGSPAGVIGDGLRSAARGTNNNSPLQGVNSW